MRIVEANSGWGHVWGYIFRELGAFCTPTRTRGAKYGSDRYRNPALASAPKAYKLFDGGGLHLLITPSGGKLWRWKYRFQGAEKQMTGHGFRGLASTILHEQGYNHDHIELQLAHAPRNAVSAAYNHALYLEPRARMMQDGGLLGEDAARLEGVAVSFSRKLVSEKRRQRID